ncbi:MAG: ATP-binding cassette domain-containing protein [Desulfobacteraceae bacterium]|nr:ATP-binding cassette domain-containing protein [Desulfobacteraceae bacterium]
MTEASDKSGAKAGNPPVLEVNGLAKRFGDRQVVRGLDFRIERGECLGFLGPNGAGKTTTILMLLGLVEKSAGESRIFGLPVNGHLRAIKQRVGVASQTDNLDPDLTVEENLLIYASYFGMGRQQARRRAGELLDFFALSQRKGDLVPQLSGGQRRRLILARALVNEPELLILDEPTIGLDPQSRHLIWERLATLRSQGTTMLLTSHYLEEVSRLSSRVVIIDEGRIVAQGEPQRMIAELVGVDVFEVPGPAAALDAIEAAVALCDATVERVKDKLYIYARAECPELEEKVRAMHGWLRRPANLEDLFIQLTGRSLREA